MKRLHQYGQTTRYGESPIGVAILTGEEFVSGAMRGERGSAVSTGQLDWQAAQLMRDDNPSYVVYSYATPIAWYTPDRGGMHTPYWTVPDRKYSVTTTRHQAIVKRALSSMGLIYEE